MRKLLLEKSEIKSRKKKDGGLSSQEDGSIPLFSIDDCRDSVPAAGGNRNNGQSVRPVSELTSKSKSGQVCPSLFYN